MRTMPSPPRPTPDPVSSSSFLSTSSSPPRHSPRVFPPPMAMMTDETWTPGKGTCGCTHSSLRSRLKALSRSQNHFVTSLSPPRPGALRIPGRPSPPAPPALHARHPHSPPNGEQTRHQCGAETGATTGGRCQRPAGASNPNITPPCLVLGASAGLEARSPRSPPRTLHASRF